MKKACYRCGYTEENSNSQFCPKCGRHMRNVLYEDEHDIAVSALNSDSKYTFGYHVLCQGILNIYNSPKVYMAKVVFCRTCGWRFIIK